MKKLKENIIIILVAGIIALGIIKCQEAQRKCKIEPEVLGIGQHKEVYYQYQDYINKEEN